MLQKTEYCQKLQESKNHDKVKPENKRQEVLL